MTQLAIRRSRSGVAALGLLAFAQFVVILDGWIMNTTLPTVAADLHLTPAELSWVVNSYLLPFGGLLLLGGRLADAFGPRRLFVAGLCLFGGGSLIGGLAPSAPVLFAGRAVQGSGGALLAPAALTLLVRLNDEGPARNRALAAWGALAAIGAPAGAVLGGVLTEAAGWSAVLLVNVPICAAAAAISLAVLPPLPARSADGPFDVGGALTATGSIAVLLYALVGAGASGWLEPGTIALLAISAGLMWLFLLLERRSASPLLPPGFVRARPVAAASGVAVLLQASQFGAFLFVALCLQDVVGLAPAAVGLMFVPQGVIVIAGAAICSRLIALAGLRWAIVGGVATLGGGLLWLTAVTTDAVTPWLLLPGMLLHGLGAGVAFVGLNVVGLSGVAERDTGLAGGLLRTSQEVGNTIGLAISVAVYAISLQSGDAASATRVVFGVGAAIALAAGLTALLAVPCRGRET